jgi:hypothetical protein
MVLQPITYKHSSFPHSCFPANLIPVIYYYWQPWIFIPINLNFFLYLAQSSSYDDTHYVALSLTSCHFSSPARHSVLYSSLSVRDQVSYAYRTTDKLIVLYILILTFLVIRQCWIFETPLVLSEMINVYSCISCIERITTVSENFIDSSLQRSWNRAAWSWTAITIQYICTQAQRLCC